MLWSAPALLFAQAQTNSSSTETRVASTTIASPVLRAQSASQLSASGLSPDEEEEIEELEEEVGDRDPTYLRTRLVFRYDYRRPLGPVSINRLRLRALYAFGPKQRLAVSFLEPLIQVDTPTGTASGSGDAEVQFNANVIYRDRFRAGVGIQSTLQTSSDALIGGATTTIRPFCDLTGILSSRVELTAAFYYKRSIHTTRGLPFKQFEPDITLNTRLLDTTWFFEWDSFYDFLPERFAQTLKPGVSRAFGPNRRWVASAYYGLGINDYARLTQYHYNPGLDITWYPRKHR